MLIQEFTLPLPDKKEICRYAGIRDGGDKYAPLLEQCIEEALPCLVPQVCWTELDVTVLPEEGPVKLAEHTVYSKDLAKNFKNCTRVILFGATVGARMDRLIARYSAVSPAAALFMDALGNERIEALCDAFCHRLAEEKKGHALALRPRFSPGYGDLPLDYQKQIFSLLDCGKIGLTLNESLLMSPSKSVTALIGLYENKETPI